MVAKRRVDNLGRFAISLEQFGADRRVTTFHFMIGRFADVVQESAAACQGSVEPKLLAQQTGEVGDLDRMPADVLAVADTKIQSTHQLDDLLVQAGDAGLLRRLEAELTDPLVHLLLRFADNFLDAAGVNAAVLDEFD